MAVKLWTVHFMRICVANLLLFISLYVLFPVLPIEMSERLGLPVTVQPERRHKSLYALFTAHSDKVKISCNRAFEMGRYILLAVIAELFQCSAGMPKLDHCRFLTLFAGSHRHKIVACRSINPKYR